MRILLKALILILICEAISIDAFGQGSPTPKRKTKAKASVTPSATISPIPTPKSSPKFTSEETGSPKKKTSSTKPKVTPGSGIDASATPKSAVTSKSTKSTSASKKKKSVETDQFAIEPFSTPIPTLEVTPDSTPVFVPTVTPSPLLQKKTLKEKNTLKLLPELPPEPLPKKTPASPTPFPVLTPTPSTTPSPDRNATISTDQIIEFSEQPPKVQNFLRLALELTKKNLTYTYGSADPANGGMDCSGYVFYVLNQNDITEVPRQASEQYVWVRKAGTFRAVLGNTLQSFEFNELQPGDLLFWIGTYKVDRDPPVTHTMIYLGTEKGSNNKIMVGSSDGRTYQGKSRWGVSVFDFKMPFLYSDPEKRSRSSFVGYAKIPGLRE